MALSVALALSGLDVDDFAEPGLKTIFDQGSKVVQCDSSPASRSTSRSSSQDSGIVCGDDFIDSNQRFLEFFDGLCLIDDVSNVVTDTKTADETIPEETEAEIAAEGTDLRKEEGTDEEAKQEEEQRDEVQEEEQEKVQEVLVTKVIYQGRDILDLAANLNGSWCFQYAILQSGINNFFDNRSQLSRLDGVMAPPHDLVRCKDCDFFEPHYY
ncbi:uncharacterized protein LOC109602895 isoform X2 [Aethina tumida]|nr:uncharacterized protein LOC109602895 isoform X2 [Aethina tumida]